MPNGVAVFFITIDTDWAPYELVAAMLGMIHDRGLKATVFATCPHEYPQEDWLEVGLHPNFLPGSSHGEHREVVMARLTAMHQRAVGIRVHGLFWGAEYAELYRRHGLLYDASWFAPLRPRLGPMEQEGLWRMPIFWTDNLHLRMNFSLEEVFIPFWQSPGMKVLVFHPMLVAWNISRAGEYQVLKERFSPLDRQDPEELRRAALPGPGLGVFFEILLDRLAEDPGNTFCLREALPMPAETQGD